MTFNEFVFYLFAAILVFAALRVITARNPVHAALFLVLAFATSAGIWIQLQAEFLAIALVLVVEMAIVLGGQYFGLGGSPLPPPLPADYSNTRELGRLVYTDYVYPFEIAAVILLVAIVAAISLTLRRRKETKHQDPARQIAVRRKDRVRIVKMPAEKRD